jgi:hypothetical protein
MKNIIVFGIASLLSIAASASYKCPQFPSTPKLAPLKMELDFSNDRNHAILAITSFEVRINKTVEVLPKVQQLVDGAIYSNSDFSISAGFGGHVVLTNLKNNENVVCQ